MRSAAVTVLLTLTLAISSLASCNGDDGYIAEVPLPLKPACMIGTLCAENQACCDGDSLLRCTKGRFAEEKRCRSDERCSDAFAECLCDPSSAKRCVAVNPTIEQVCVPLLGGVGVFTDVSCAPGEACVAGKGCVDIPGCDTCIYDDVQCSEDLKSVLGCTENPETNCLQFHVIADCYEVFMECSVPDDLPTSTFNYCMNACGGRGDILPANPCDPVKNLPCSVFACDFTTQTLVTDHTACHKSGMPCANDSECASCSCQKGVCVGDSAERCPIASMCR